MKQVIDGLTYNTATATEIAKYSKGPTSDLHHYEETLYKTKNSRFFLVGGGGPMSGWAKPAYGGGTCGSTGILALTIGKALEWCEHHDVDADIIEQHFDVEVA